MAYLPCYSTLYKSIIMKKYILDLFFINPYYCSFSLFLPLSLHYFIFPHLSLYCLITIITLYTQFILYLLTLIIAFSSLFLHISLYCVLSSSTYHCIVLSLYCVSSLSLSFSYYYYYCSFSLFLPLSYHCVSFPLFCFRLWFGGAPNCPRPCSYHHLCIVGYTFNAPLPVFCG